MRLGAVSSTHNTASIESRLQKWSLDLVKADLMPKWIYDAIRPTGSQRPQIYDCRKHTKKALHFSLYCLWQVRPMMNLESGWLAYYNLCWSGFRHIAFQIAVVVITPPHPQDGDMARMAIQVHAVNLIKIRLGERWQPILNQSWVAPPR